MLFSILIATNNSASTVRAALESVKAQTLTDHELIVIDNRSSDGTLDLVRSTIPTAQVISEPDAGIYDALNKGLVRAQGDWIYVLGSDDQLADTGVLQCVANAADNTASLIYGNVLSVGATSSKQIQMRSPDEYKRMGVTCPPIFHQSAFMRRSILPRTGSFPLSFRIHADHFLLTRAYLLSPAIYIDRLICIYHSGGYSQLAMKNYFRSTREQLVINAFFGARMLSLVKPFAKNFVRAVINQVQR